MAEEAFSESQAGGATGENVEPVGVVETEAPAVGGQAGVETETAEPMFDPSQYGDHLVTVKVGGEEQQVPLSEALNGYQRQADYTRKTQQAKEALALKTAIESDPATALRMLAARYDVRFGDQPDVSQTAGVEESFDQGEVADPRYQELMQQVQMLTERETERELDQVLGGLSQKYGEHFNEQELLVAAQQHGVRSPGELEGVFRNLMFDKFYAQATAREQHASSVQADDAAREQAVNDVQRLVASGNGTAPGAPASSPPVINSFEDAFAAAARQHGISF